MLKRQILHAISESTAKPEMRAGAAVIPRVDLKIIHENN